MKRIAIYLLALLALAGPVLAKAQAGEKIKEIQRNVYTRVLLLTDEEAKKFWPVFDKMQAEMKEVLKERRKERKKINDNYASMSDAEMEKSVDRIMELEKKLVDIRARYYQEFKKVLPIKKVALLPKAEKEFKKELVQILRSRRGGRGGGGDDDDLDLD